MALGLARLDLTMPIKALYWKDPERHKRQSRESRARARALGFPDGLHFDTYERTLRSNRMWHLRHQDELKKLRRAYELKFKAKHGVWRHSHIGEMIVAELRQVKREKRKILLGGKHENREVLPLQLTTRS